MQTNKQAWGQSSGAAAPSAHSQEAVGHCEIPDRPITVAASGPFWVVPLGGAHGPQRCYACNAPAPRVTKGIVKSPDWVLLSLLGLAAVPVFTPTLWLTPFVLIFLQHTFGTRILVNVHSCRPHWRRQRRGTAISWSLIALMVPVMFVAGYTFSPALSIGLQLLVGACFAAAMLTPRIIGLPFAVDHLDGHHAWLSRTGPQFRASLPVFTGSPSASPPRQRRGQF